MGHPPVGQGLLIHEFSRSHPMIHHSRQDSSGRVISSLQRPLSDNTQHSQQTNVHAPGEIRTHSLSRRAAADQRLRPRGHWNRVTKFYLGNRIKNNEMGGACSTYGGEAHTGFWWGSLREGDHLEDAGVDREIILKRLFKKWGGSHGLERRGSGLRQVTGCCECRNEPQSAENFLTSWGKGLCSVDRQTTGFKSYRVLHTLCQWRHYVLFSHERSVEKSDLSSAMSVLPLPLEKHSWNSIAGITPKSMLKQLKWG